uniref:Putative secreted protein n=1 Tax=Anopheles darlingi TaxID=43151 RepID=A0A2M4DA29_ANODA
MIVPIVRSFAIAITARLASLVLRLFLSTFWHGTGCFFTRITRCILIDAQHCRRQRLNAVLGRKPQLDRLLPIEIERFGGGGIGGRTRIIANTVNLRWCRQWWQRTIRWCHPGRCRWIRALPR